MTNNLRQWSNVSDTPFAAYLRGYSKYSLVDVCRSCSHGNFLLASGRINFPKNRIDDESTFVKKEEVGGAI